jgi:hypothetical protein
LSNFQPKKSETMEKRMIAQNAPSSPFAHKKAASRLLLAISALTFFLISKPLVAQSFNEVPVEAFGVAIQSPAQYLQNGEKATIHIEVGSSFLPVANAAGYELHVNLSAHASFNTATAEGWIAASGGRLGVEYIESSRELILSYDADADQAGFGKVLSLELNAIGNDVDASKMVSSATGLMIIDNLDARYAGPATSPAISVFPNPFKDRLEVKGGNDVIEGCSVWNLQGQMVAEFGAVSNLDLGHLPAGSYLLRIQHAKGQVVQMRIQKQ